MPTHAECLRTYTEITQCTKSCDGIVNDRARGLIPRSFYWSSTQTRVTLLVVSKNPANAPDWESTLYARTLPNELASVHYDVAHEVFRGVRSVPSNYHVNLVKRVAAVLGVPATPEAVFMHAAMTALAKFQSKDSKTAKIPDLTFTTCAETHFLEEVRLFRPIYLLALGKEPYDVLTRP